MYPTLSRQRVKDQQAITKLKLIYQANPYYGVARLAIALGWNTKKARRIRDLAGISANKLGITLSCSDKGSPWQNGFKEGFYGTLKTELGQLSRFKDLAELYEGIVLTIYYYNHKRIHTSLKMSPSDYTLQLASREKPTRLRE